MINLQCHIGTVFKISGFLKFGVQHSLVKECKKTKLIGTVQILQRKIFDYKLYYKLIDLIILLAII